MKFLLWTGIVLSLLCCPLFCAQLNDAIAAFEKGDAASAEQILRELLKSDANDPAALGLLGVTLDTEKKYEDAGVVFRHALRVTPRSANLLNNYANHQLATGDVNGAETTYRKVLVFDPSRANANLQLASIAVQKRNGAEAIGYLEHLKPNELSNPQVEILEMQALYLAGRASDAGRILARVSAAVDPRVPFSAGLGLASIGRYEDAETLFSRVLRAAPSDLDVLYNLGLAAYHAHHLERARDALQTVSEQRPKDVDTLYNLAEVDIDLQDREKALELLAEASRLDSARPNVQLSLAQTTSALGYYADSVNAYDRYLKLVPNDASAKREHAFVLAASGDRERGLTDLRSFLRAHPRDATAEYELGTLEAQSDAKDALANLEKAITLQPDFAPARFGRGVTNLIGGNAGAALPDLQFAAQRYPENATVLDRLGEAYLALDRGAEAVKVLKQASEIAPKDAKILMHLSRAYAKAGQSEEAHATLARFRAVGSDQVNRLPAAGIVDFLALSPEEQQTRYRAEVEKRSKENPQDPDLKVRRFKLLLDVGDVEQARVTAAELLALHPAVPLAAEAGQVLVTAELFAEAKPLLEYAVSAPGAPQARLDLAIAIFHLQGAPAGLAELDRVPSGERNGNYFLARSQMLDAVGKPDDAHSALQRGLQSAPTRVDLYQANALFLTRNHHADDAVALLERAEKTLAPNPRIELLKAGALAASSHADRAEATLKDTERRWPEWAPAYVTYGILLEGQKRAEEAKAQLENAAALGASGSELFLYLARAILDATPDQVDAAHQAIAQALALAPNDPWIQGTAGRIDYARKDYQAAIDHLTAAVHLRPNYLQARFTLAQAYRAVGRKDEAARESAEFQRLRAENPGDSEELSSQ